MINVKNFLTLQSQSLISYISSSSVTMATSVSEGRGVHETQEGSDGGGAEEDEGSITGSEVSSIVNNGSVISTVPDRHGFLGGAQYCPDE